MARGLTELIRIYRLDDLETIPEPSWLIADILHRETLSALVATRGAFKTFLALDWGLCIATGTAWNGRAVRQGNVLHIVGEGGTGIRKRAQAWYQEKGIARSAIARWACTVHRVDIAEQTDWLVESVEQAFNGEPLELLVVDTLARNSSGNENDTKEMSRLIVQSDLLKDRFGCNVLFVHHNNKAGEFRGNTALDGAFQTVVAMDRKKDSDVVNIRCDKQKDSEEFPAFCLRRRKVHLPYDRDSIVLEPCDSPAEGEEEERSDPHDLPNFIRILDLASAHGLSHADGLVQFGLAGWTAQEFEQAWAQAIKQNLMTLAEETPTGVGTRWIRNLGLIELAV